MTRKEYLEIARRVLRIEQTALGLLAETLDEGFGDAVETLLQAKGRVIVCGMGKSGHVARKIAATFASTGTPAQFVHPSEASHGDLGMMARGDVALILSNSGETPELVDVVAYTRRFSIPLIGVASKRESSLIRQSDVALILPPVEEACGTGNVPTTTTTMSLALGDALAIALMEHRQFTPANFREFHPGGKLGAQLSRVGDLMHRDDEVPTVHYTAPMADALLTMSEKTFGVAGVLNDAGELEGIITDGDLRRHMSGLLDLNAGEVMTKAPRTIHAGALAEEALAVMNANKIGCLFVTEAQKPVGLIRIHDCLRVGLG
ncbi:MAG: KpsF/GutQ family sugar-phosphate isomerase [Pseudomonadota bacterium]